MKVLFKGNSRFFSTLVIVILIACFSVTYAFITNYYNYTLKASKNQNVNARKDVIIIDAGHGGIDSGAVGSAGVLEKDINLFISQNLMSLFSLSDMQAYTTRSDDRLLYSEDDIRTKKSQDIQNRVLFTQQFDKPVFVSIHQNKFPLSKYHGLQVYYSKNNKNSKTLAAVIQENIKNNLQNDNNRQTKEVGSHIYVLKNLDCPAVLVECGFLSNPQEEQLLNDTQYRKKLSICIFASLLNYEDTVINGKE